MIKAELLKLGYKCKEEIVLFDGGNLGLIDAT